MKIVLLIQWVLVALLWGGSAYGEDTKSQAATPDNTATVLERHPLQIKADSLWQDMLQTEADINRLKKQIEQEQGESQDSLFLRVTQRQLALLSDYTELTNNLLQQQQQQLDISEQQALLQGRMLPMGPRIRRAIDRRDHDLQMEGAKIDPLSNEALQLLSERNYYSDMAYQALSQHSNNLERLGFNNDQTATYLKSTLQSRAESLAGQIQISVTQRERIDADLAADKENSELKAQARSAQKKQNVLTDSLRKTIFMMDDNAIDSASYRQLLIRTTGELTTDILKPEILWGLIGNWLDRALTFLKQYSTEIIFKTLMFMGILLIFLYLSRFVGRIVRKALKRGGMRVSKLMEEMLVGMAARIVFIVGFLIALGQMGVSLAPVLAGLGVAGFIIGFALQDTLSNFASGIMILIYRPYDVGDMIEAGGVKGNVESMNLVSTTILTIDHQTLIIPNNKIWGDVINNLTARKVRRVDMTFGVGYAENTAQVEAILIDIIESHPKTLAHPEYLVKLHMLSESSVDFIVRPWVKTDDYWDVYWDITRAVKDRFDQEGISIPFPQRDVHLYQHDPA